MTLLYESTFQPTLAVLIKEYATRPCAGMQLEAWVFDDEAARKAAEKRMAARGVAARFRSAYKPLVHFFLEEVELASVARVTITYPVHAHCVPNRFLLEAYPLAALVGETPIDFVAGNQDDFTYHVNLHYADGRIVRHDVFAPNRLHADHADAMIASPTGWIRLRHAGATLEDRRLETDYEALFARTMAAIAGHDWGNREPYFEELCIRVSLPGSERRLSLHEDLPTHEETISLHEALHEDFYFTLLEFFQKKSSRARGDRSLQPGQIVPEIRRRRGRPHVAVEIRPLRRGDKRIVAQDLTSATRSLGVAQIRAELEKIPGEAFEARSRAGRLVRARYHAGLDAAVMISGGQHANETTGIVGALRAAQTLAGRPGAHFVISPLENPDGYALHQRLCAENPCHMHHAARYTAFGDDLEFRTGEALYERGIRVQALEKSSARLHVNLHGYPAHEWTRPLSGYVPCGFEMWTLPKGFFLIMRHHAEWEAKAEALLDRVTRSLADTPGLLAFNAAQIRLYETHSGKTGFRMINGFPCLVSTDSRSSIPMTLITEYPDETIYDDAFVTGHSAQTALVLAAYDALQQVQADDAK